MPQGCAVDDAPPTYACHRQSGIVICGKSFAAKPQGHMITISMARVRITGALSGLLLLALLVASVPAAAQQATGALFGTIIDAENGEPLPRAHVYVETLSRGATASIDGRYRIEALTPGTYTIAFSFTGYQNQEFVVTVAAGEERELAVNLSPGVELDPIQISASRRRAKSLDAPASVDVILGSEIAHETAPSTIKALRNITGVDMAQTGIDRHEVVLRGFNDAFSSSTYVLTDYRHAAVPSFGVNLHNVMPTIGSDVERIEVVRGPGSALYGPGVTSGVIHYITKDAFSYPGATVSVRAGGQSMLDFQGRIASVIGKRLGLKVTGAHTAANDFELERCNESLLENGRFDQCPDSLDARQIAMEGIRDSRFRKLNLNGSLEYRLGDRTSLIVQGGHSQLTATVLSSIGTIQAEDYGYTYGQVRFQSGNFFAQAYTNRNNGDKSYVYGSQPVIEKGKTYTFQAQQDLSLADGRQQLIFGADVRLTRPNTLGTILGANEEIDSLDEYGAYLQSTTKLNDAFELTLAARGDYNTVVNKFRLSPRAALVYRPTPTSSLRATFNRSFTSPNPNTAFLDLIATRIPGANIIIRARGSAPGFTWARNPAFRDAGAPNDLVASSLLPGSVGQPMPIGVSTADVYGLVYEGLAALPINELLAQMEQLGFRLNEAAVGIMLDLLRPDRTRVSGFSPGRLALLNLTSQRIGSYPEDLTDIRPIRQTTSQTFEFGYKGIVNSTMLVAIDAYFGRKEGFTGPLTLVTPFVLVPTLAEDFQRDLTIAIQDNVTLATTLRAVGLSPETVAELLVQFASENGLSPETPVGIVQPVENNPGIGQNPELMLTYRNFGKINYQGIDVSVHVLASENARLFGNVSWVSDDYFDYRELKEDDKNISLALNASQLKVKFGGAYTHASGLFMQASGRYTKGFPIASGFFVGELQNYFVLDAGAGYIFRNRFDGLRVDLGVSNVLDSNHREFVGAPKLGRVVIGRLTYTIDFHR